MQLVSLLSWAVSLGCVAAAPAAAPEEECKPRTLCVDGINTCGVRFGGCYDTCKPELRPIAPLCVPATTASSSSKATSVTVTTTSIVTHTLIPPTTRPIPTPRTSACLDGREGSGYTVCWDGINDCGQMYGGCFADCKPWPTFSKPPCRTITTSKTVSSPPPEPTPL
ncbi:hypothetical protein B0T16DRAFT_60231 [Cercophora newfieldiana]|uniref:Uncharacterized protein n=1 Tax=Cercophora newfieldiana TaxID=92897 RepID=A0AA39YSN5_9PEZI|nr:hypothetical protein B0T16DRAFT_60231 [Cercophora newfieldiana]